MDLVSCRNLLIYFSPTLQRHILNTFGYSLQPGGCLILGSSETLGSLSEYFQPLDESHKIYCRKSNAAQGVYPLSEPDGDHLAAHLRLRRLPRPPRRLPRPIRGSAISTRRPSRGMDRPPWW